ncbi:MAG: galactokinase [bacterium]|jgi:galactokinase
MISKDWISDFFQTEFAKKPKCFRAPGRINLIGEHTDYNQGFVMPAGIDFYCYVAISASREQSSSVLAYDYQEKFSFNVSPENPTTTHWVNYILGVIKAIKKRGKAIPAFNAVVRSDIPVGAGLSSSAALESVFATAFNSVFDLGFSPMELTLIAKEAENDFVGLKCGIMDMFASIHAKQDHAIRLDCRSLQHEYFPLALGENKILLFDTCIKHELASSEYNLRRLECEAGVSRLQQLGYAVESLRDVDTGMLQKEKAQMDGLLFKRAKYVVDENNRVEQFSKAISGNDWKEAGRCLYASHDGLKNDYEVSCKELDSLVDTARACEGVWGARMMGGGFGGCTINLVRADKLDEVVERCKTSYFNSFGVEPKYYIATTGDGACEI